MRKITFLGVIYQRITPLTDAAMKGHTATAKYLLEHGATLGGESGLSAMHHAAGNGNFELLKFLLDKGVSVDLRTAMRCTPLAWAALNSRENVVNFLLEHGADAGADPNFVADGVNPLHLAANGGIVKIINLLLKAGANPDAISDVLFQEDGYNDEGSRKAIEVAAARGHQEAVEILFPITERIDTIDEWSVDGILGELQPEHLREKKGRKRGQPKSRV